MGGSFRSDPCQSINLITDEIPNAGWDIKCVNPASSTTPTRRFKKPPTRGTVPCSGGKRAIYDGADRAIAALRRGSFSTFQYRRPEHLVEEEAVALGREILFLGRIPCR
jgi:hypothetical protein